MILNNQELAKIQGGGKSKKTYGLLIALGGVIALAVGIIDGYLRPLKCN